MSIRRLLPADVQALALVEVETKRAAYRNLLPVETAPLSVAVLEQEWREIAADPAGQPTWVADAGGVPVGYACCRVAAGDGPAEVSGLYVAPPAQGRGLGGQLLAAALTGLRSLRHDEVVLQVVAGNASARAFYESKGWLLVGPADELWHGLEEVVYRAPAAVASATPAS